MEYYIAEKSCMMGIHSRLMLEVNEDKKVRICAGESNERFGFNEEGRLTHLSWDGKSLSYHISDPIPEDLAKKMMDDDAHNGYKHNFDRFPRRIHSLRRVGNR